MHPASSDDRGTCPALQERGDGRPRRSHCWSSEHNQAGSGCSLRERGHLGDPGPPARTKRAFSPLSLWCEHDFFLLSDCDQMHHSPPGSSVHGVFRARLLQWVSMPSSQGSSRPKDCTCVSASSALQADSSLLSHRRREEHVPPAPNCSGLNGVSQRFLHVLTLEPRNVTLFGKGLCRRN